MKRLLIIGFLFFLNISVFSQSFFSPGAWKKYRKEWQVSFGASNFLGELGGKDAIGTNFLKDWEVSQTRYSGRAAFGYYIGASWIYRSQINFGLVAGNDKLTQEPFRNNRNLHFQSIIVGFNQNLQWLFVRERGGNRYGLKNIKGRKIGARAMSYGYYLTAGIGVFYYNPKARANANSGLVALRPLHTEGQGLPGGPKQYKTVSVDIPVGIGIRRAINRQWGAYMEFTQHYTFTDYIDDVSTVYYDNAAIEAAYGPTAAYLADPSLSNYPESLGGSTVLNQSAAGQQRGDVRDRDNFMFLTIGAFYKVKTNSGYGGGKKKKIKALF